MTVSANQIRDEIVAQHSSLRALLPRIESLAEEFEQASEAEDLGSRLRDAGLALYELFGAHLVREQELLEPVLRAAGPEGQRLARRLGHEHREQRQLLDYLLTRLLEQPAPTVVIARQLTSFTHFLRIEMDHEEETVLASSILGDSGDGA